ncbi:MAG TPA: hypothetical protein VHE78_04770 [Gemmatimonadaceae bacterium]|nr:hypothetical protein [Gemmatimonadaceae bacterium]
MKSVLALAATLLFVAPGPMLRAQENYEIQVYPSQTAEKGTTLFELHSNFTGTGRRVNLNGVLPSNGAIHETLEITHGFNEIFEVGFYMFTNVAPGEGWQFVGSHLRPRVRAPESWKLPVGLSLSTEFGPTGRKFDASEFGIEVRPIIDQTIGRFYWALNPAVGWSLKGPDAGTGVHGMNFSPAAKLGWQVSHKLQAGIEYYGTTGSLARLSPSGEQSHLVYPSIDLLLSPDWEFNAGYGVLVSGTGDRNIFKMILGRRFGW